MKLEKKKKKAKFKSTAKKDSQNPRFTMQSLMLLVLFNGAMLAAFYFMLREFFQGVHVWVDPLLQGGGAQLLPEAAGSRVSELMQFIQVQERVLPWFLLGLGGFVSLLLWFGLQVMVRTLVRTVLAFSGVAGVGEKELKGSKKQGKPGEEPQPPRKLEPAYSPEAALQLLSMLQQQGRLIDFLEEDLGTYEDAQIGAAVRGIHEGCRKALHEHLELKPVFEQEEEGAEVTVKPGFDPNSIRLTGKVVGDPPFRGVLRHRGWKVVKVDLPQPVSSQGKQTKILAPAEVEMEGGE